MSPCHGEDRQFKSDRGRHILFFTILYAVVAEWQTRYFEGVVIFRSCEFKSHQPHHSFFYLIPSIQFYMRSWRNWQTRYLQAVVE